MSKKFITKAVFVTLILGIILNTAFASPNTNQNVEVQDPFSTVEKIESIECRNNTTTDCDFIKKQILISAGQTVDSQKLDNSRIRLKLLGLFKQVHLLLEKGTSKGNVKLVIDVQEDSHLYTVTGLTAGSNLSEKNKGDVFGRADLTVGYRNLYGTGKNISASVSTYADQTYSGAVGSVLLRYNDPNLLGSKKWFFNIDLFSDVDRRGNWNGEDHLGSLEIGKRFSKFSYWTLGSVSQIKNLDVKNSSVYGSFESSAYKHYISLGYGYNTQDDLFFPTHGARFDLKLLFLSNEKHLSGVQNGASLDDDGLIGDLDFSITAKVRSHWYTTLFIESRNQFFDQDNFLNSGLGTEIAYQKRFNQTEKTISDIRYFVAPSITSFGGFNGSEAQVAAGVKLRHKDYGLVRLQVIGGGL